MTIFNSRDSTADNYLELPMSSSECSSSAVLRTKSNDKLSEISSDNTNAKPIEENRQRTTMDHQYSNSWQDIQNQFPVLHRDRQNVMGKVSIIHMIDHYEEECLKLRR